jgi:glycosyltransferase involved in cell wall biosynthesis
MAIEETRTSYCCRMPFPTLMNRFEMDTRALAPVETLNFAPPNRAGPRKRALRVGVLVDLPLGSSAGGHVRCWERLAEAARGFPGWVDLTVHFMGPQAEYRRLGENVHYRVEPPIFSTERLPFLSHVPDHTDLSPWHPRLARSLAGYDVIHTTDAFFAYAQTAMKVGQRLGIPIVNSVHTNTPEYARLFTAQTVERLFGGGPVANLLLSRFKVAETVGRRMQRQLSVYQSRCAFALVSRPDQLDRTRAMLGGRAGLLRRGIDREVFHPGRRDREWLSATYGIPATRLVVMAAGRLNQGKNILLLAEAVGTLIRRGIDAHLICAGDGDQRATIMDRLGPRATCPGNVEPAQLARLYAAADLFAMPSRIEESANVVLEAFASGLPVLVAGDSGMGRAVRNGETGLILPGDNAEAWSHAIASLNTDHDRRRVMARAARQYAQSEVPSWAEVLAEDLLPHWEAAATGRELRIAA